MNPHAGRAQAAGELTEAELANEHAQALPAREAMSAGGFDPTGWEHFAMPVNEALALNHMAPDSVAFAEADQTVIVGPLDDPAQEG